MKLRDWINDHIVPEARQWWRWWSVRLNAAGLALLTWVQIDPVSVLTVWNMMPPTVQRVLPPNPTLALAFVLFSLALISRLVRQPKLEKK